MPEASTLFTNFTFLGPAEVFLREVYVRYTDPLAIAFVSTAGAIILIAIGFGVWTAVLSLRGVAYIQMSSPPFMFAVLVGCILLCVAVMISNEASDVNCSIASTLR